MKLKEQIRRIPLEYRKEILFLLAVTIYYMTWAYVQPYDVSPDEAMRYDVAKYIYNHGALPRGDEPEIMNDLWGISYAFNPILSYMFAACAMKVMSFFSQGPFKLLFAARMVSVMFGVGTIFFCIRIAKKVFDKRLGKTFVLILAFIPNMAFLSSYVNTDAMGIFTTAFIVYAWLRVMEEEWTWQNCVLLGLGVGLCAMSYYNSYGFILCSILLFAATVLFGEKSRWDFKKLFSKGLLISAIVLAICGWWFVRNYFLYDGDFTGRYAMNACAELHGKVGFKPSDHPTPKDWGYTPITMLFAKYPLPNSWLHMVAQSFIGIFGRVSISMPSWYYITWWVLLGVGFLGVFLTPKKMFALRSDGHWRNSAWVHWTMLVAMVIPNVLSVWYSYYSDYQAQGRYSFPMIVPLIYFVVIGYRNLLERFCQEEHKRDVIMLHIGIVSMLLGIISYLDAFLPVYVPFFD